MTAPLLLQVVERVRAAFSLSGTFLEDLAGRIDCYGPVWISITLAVLIFIAGSLSTYSLLPTPDYLSILSSSLFYILFYLGIVVGGGWMVLRWLGADSIYFTELLCLFGYSLVFFFPLIAISQLRIKLLTWLAALAVGGASSFFVYQNLYAALRTSALGVDRAFFYSVVILFLHAIFVLSVKALFL